LSLIFQPVLVWNGYFTASLISFFFTLNISGLMTQAVVLDYFIGFDGLNIWLIWLTALLVFSCALYLLDTI
jgi:hypothetical protein